MKTAILLFTFILFTVLQVSSQTTIKGRIIDSESKQSIPYTTIRLIQNDSLIAGTLSNEKGFFFLNNVNATDCLLEISFLSYSKKQLPLHLDQATINLEPIELEKKEEILTEIDVIAEKYKINELIDKSIFQFSTEQIKNKKDALELLKIIPGIRIDSKTNKVNLIGEDNLRIYINGIERQSIDLKSIKPEEIERIELISNPSSKYDSEFSAIINVILKKEIIQGFSSDIKVNYYTLNIYNTSRASVQYGFEKIKLNLAYNLFSRKSEAEENIYRKTDSGETILEYYSKKIDSKKRKQLGQFLNYGFDYFVNDKNTVSFAANNGWYSQKTPSITDTELFENSILKEMHRLNIMPIYSQFAENYSIFFEHKFKKQGESLIISSNFYNFNSGITSDYIDSVKINNNLFLENYKRRESTNLDKGIQNFKIDYSNLINGKYKLETGYQYYIQDFNSYYSNSLTLNEYQYYGNKNAIYTNISYFGKKISTSFGVRLEQLTETISDTLTTNYFHFLPDFSFLKKIDEQNSVRINFSRKLRYPTLESLNPYIQYSDSMNISVGNYNLKPSILNNCNLDYTYKKEDFYIKTAFYASYSNNKISSIITIDENNRKIIKPMNIGNFKEFGLQISSSFLLFEILTLNPAINIFHREFKIQEDTNEGFSYEFSIAPEVFFDNELYIGLDFFLKGKDILIQAKEKSRPWFEVYAGMPILKKKGSLYLGITPFNDLYQAVYNENNYYMESREVEKLQTIYIEFSYTFHKGEKLKQANAKSIFEKDF